MRIEEFQAEKSWWLERRETERPWRVGIDEIRGRGFNLDVKNPNTPALTHEHPDALLERCQQARAAAEIRDQRRRALSDAVETT
jgi:type I restriction enzyme M protein